MNPPEKPFALFPEQASTHAASVDALFFFIIGVSFVVATLTAVLLIYFSIRYRRRAEDYYPKPIVGSTKLEYGWTILTFLVFMFIFFWGASLYFRMVQPPEGAMEIYVTGKQWMWKIQHPSGQTEINELHVPVGQPVRLIMTSEDVIHDFFIPSFRIKQDVMPGRYSYLWFEATKPGTYHLFCAEYCGKEHSKMIGWVTVMEPEKYADWLAGSANQSMANRGRQLFLKHQCIACHAVDSGSRAPNLEEIYKKRVPLQDGTSVEADENYIRESIRFPRAKLHAGYKPIMPQFGPEQMSDEELQYIVAYIKNLKRGQTPNRTEATPAPEAKDEDLPKSTSGK